MAQRQYEPVTVFNARIADMRHLCHAEHGVQRAADEKAQLLRHVHRKKTQAQWFQNRH